MECGFCGTSINEGYNTCSACGAIYKPSEEMQQLGARRVFLGLFAAAFGFLILISTQGEVELAGTGIVVFLVSLLPLLWGVVTLRNVKNKMMWHKSS